MSQLYFNDKNIKEDIFENGDDAVSSTFSAHAGCGSRPSVLHGLRRASDDAFDFVIALQ